MTKEKLTRDRLRQIICEEKRKLEEAAPGAQMKMKLDKLKRIKNNLKRDVNPNDLPPKVESKFVGAQGTLNKAIEELEIVFNAYKNERLDQSDYVNR